MTTEEIDYYEEFTKIMYMEYRKQAAAVDVMLMAFENASGDPETSERLRETSASFVGLKDVPWPDLPPESKQAFRAQTLMFFRALEATGMKVVASETLNGPAN